jgi:glutaredoxin
MIVLTGEKCAYCKKAKMLLRRALEKHPEFGGVELTVAEETSVDKKAYPHRYVPAFFCGGKLMFEGNPFMKDIEFMLSYCLTHEE